MNVFYFKEIKVTNTLFFIKRNGYHKIRAALIDLRIQYIHIYVSGLHKIILFTFEEDVFESTFSESKNLEN